ncbi:MAG: Hsp20/alpha crystallin family protein [Planctomycetes bacterium]|nr:Hsp20/alpha crystallin family protein [Planctomycetota bacterium]
MNTNCQTIETPAARIAEAGGKLQIYVDLPGVSEKELELTLEQGLLKVAAPGYERQFRLGEELDSDSISATLELGVLKLELGKRDLSRRIQIQAG